MTVRRRLRPGPLGLGAGTAARTSARSPATRSLRTRSRRREQSGVFERVVVSTDSEETAEIARWYGADVPFLRPPEYATSTSPDVEWLGFTLERLDERVRPLRDHPRRPVPFRGPETMRRGLEQLLATPEADSLRAVELVKQHPGEDVAARGRRPDDAAAARPVAPRRRLACRPVPGAAARVRAEQRAGARLDARRRGDGDARRSGRGAVPDGGLEGFSIDYDEDWERAEHLVRRG